MRRSGQLLPLWTGLYAILSASPVLADDGGRAAYADRLFQEGYRLMKSDDCPQAIPKFLSSQRLDPSAATLLNLATCYAKLGRTASAWRTFHQAADIATNEKNDVVRDRAFNGISALAPSLTKLKIVAPRGSKPMSLMLNGEPLTMDEELPVPLDPGENIIEASAPGHVPWRHTVNAADLGATIVIEVPELPAMQRADSRTDWRTAAAIIGGAGAAGIVVGSILALSAKSSFDESGQFCRDSRCNLTGHDLRVDAVNKATAATYAVGIGALFTAAGVTIWLASPARSERAIGISPWIGTRQASAGVSVGGAL